MKKLLITFLAGVLCVYVKGQTKLNLFILTFTMFCWSFSYGQTVIPRKPMIALPSEYPTGGYLMDSETDAPYNWIYDAGVILGLKPANSNARHVQMIYSNKGFPVAIRAKDLAADAWTPWAKLVIEDFNGRVGIGTTTPNYELTVNGSIGVDRNGSANYAAIELKADIGAYIDFTQGTNDFDGRIIWNHLNDGRFKIYGDVKFMNKLVEDVTIDGNLIAEEVKVQNVPQSDYVFESDYPLMSLQEVETFIKENKHLPDIPSAEGFKENGVGLGEMDNMLLRKVEELVLYTIEQQKELEELRKENEELNQNNESLIKRIEKLENQ